jgi:AsmA protein
MQTQLKNGVLALKPMTATLYQGNLQANANVNLATATPQISLQAQLNNVQAEPLLQDLQKQGGKIKIKGAGNISLQITTAGLTADAVTRNLNGSGNLSFNNGQLNGVNIGYLLDSGYALIKRQAAPTQNDNVTNFGTLTASVKINSGVVTNNDLLINGPRFTTKGQGTINLVSQQINYSLQIIPINSTAASNNGLLNFANLTIPVRVTGNLSNPNVGLDTGMLLQEVAKQQIQKVQDKIGDQIKNNLPGQAGKLLQNFLGH